MTSKYQRPAGAFAGTSGLANKTKYQDDATATPKRAISSAKVDGDLNYMIDALNQIDEASGARASIGERLDVALNGDGTLKLSVAGAMDEWVVHINPGIITRLDNSSISIAGDWRGLYQVNRRVRLTVAGVQLIGDVAGVSYAGGITAVTCIDLLDAGGNLGIVSVAPTQVAYGPLTAGVRGNTPRRVDGLKIPAGAVTYEIAGSGTDLVIKRDGVPTATVTNGGIAGLLPLSVNGVALGLDVQAMLVPSGAVMPFAGASAPNGWLMCAGQAVSRTGYFSLYSLLGTTYGAGDGSTTFNVPDLRGRAVFGIDNMGGTDIGRLSAANTLGGNGGAQTKTATTGSYTLTVADIPAHTHDVNATYGPTANAAGGTAMVYDAGTTGSRVVSKSIGGGGGHSHAITNLDVMPPFMLLNYIIKA